jgi:hypothetical protein
MIHDLIGGFSQQLVRVSLHSWRGRGDSEHGEALPRVLVIGMDGNLGRQRSLASRLAHLVCSRGSSVPHIQDLRQGRVVSEYPAWRLHWSIRFEIHAAMIRYTT